MSSILKIPKSKIKYFQDNILEWYKENGRKFHWRKKKLNHYNLIIAEVLLQRTKAETIENFYKGFLKKFPTWESITKSSIVELEEALKPVGLWKQRARSLKKLSSEMVQRNGKFPKKRSEIDTLPAVGQYIGNSIEVLVHKRPKPFLDVNMARVLERYFGERKLADIRYDPYLQELAHEVVCHLNYKEINWAILDFGALVCKARKQVCVSCCLVTTCNKMQM